MSDFLTAQCQLALDGPRLRPLSIRPECPGSGRQGTNGAADGSDDSDDQVYTFFNFGRVSFGELSYFGGLSENRVVNKYLTFNV